MEHIQDKRPKVWNQKGPRSMVQGTGYRIQDTGYRIQGTGYRIHDVLLDVV